MSVNPEKTLIKSKISDNIYSISEDETNQILFSEIKNLLDKEDYSDYFFDHSFA
jgi:hypothetical protein